MMPNIEQESTNLDLHVALCAQRYASLEQRLDDVDTRLDAMQIMIDTRFARMESTLTEISNKMERLETQRVRQLVNIGGSVIAVLLAALGWTITQLI